MADVQTLVREVCDQRKNCDRRGAAMQQVANLAPPLGRSRTGSSRRVSFLACKETISRANRLTAAGFPIWSRNMRLLIDRLIPEAALQDNINV